MADITNPSTPCNDCTGTCSGGCRDGCQEGCYGCQGCSDTCKRVCTGDCSSGCTNECMKYCKSCYNSCLGWCYDNCFALCRDSCIGICIGYCDGEYCQSYCLTNQVFSTNNEDSGPSGNGAFTWTNEMKQKEIIKISAEDWNNLKNKLESLSAYHPHSFSPVPFRTPSRLTEEQQLERQAELKFKDENGSGILVDKHSPKQSKADIGDGITADRYNDFMKAFAPERSFTDNEKEYFIEFENGAGALKINHVKKNQTILKSDLFNALSDNYNSIKMHYDAPQGTNTYQSGPNGCCQRGMVDFNCEEQWLSHQQHPPDCSAGNGRVASPQLYSYTECGGQTHCLGEIAKVYKPYETPGGSSAPEDPSIGCTISVQWECPVSS